MIKRYVPLVSVIVMIFLVMLFGFSAGILAQQTPGQQPNRSAIVSIVNVSGAAQILSNATAEQPKNQARVLSEAWKPATSKTVLSEQDQLRTGVDATLELQLDDGTLMQIASNSLVTVEAMHSARGDKPKTTQLLLAHGTITTTQSTKILGQTAQIIRTENGTVNTSLAEVEIYKPENDYANLAAAQPLSFPLLAAKPQKGDKTFVTLRKGVAEIVSSGIGQMITNSLLLPNTCQAEDGIKFTLDIQNAQVNIAKLEDEQAFRLSSKEPFELLAGTEGSVNKIDIATLSSDGIIDVEGVNVAEVRKDSRFAITLNELLTIGVKSADMLIKFACVDAPTKGLNIFDIQTIAGDVNILTTSLGGAGTGAPNPSKGAVMPPSVRTPTPTPTGTTIVPGEEIPPEIPAVNPNVPGIQKGEGENPVPPPITDPITHTFAREPKILNLTVTSTLNGPGCSGIGNYAITGEVDFENYLPTIIGGRLFSILTNSSWTPYANFSYGFYASDNPRVNWISYSYAWPMEKGHVTYTFCRIRPGEGTIYFRVYLVDVANNTGAVWMCQGDPAVVGDIKCSN